MGCVIQRVFCCETDEHRRAIRITTTSQTTGDYNGEFSRVPMDQFHSLTDPNLEEKVLPVRKDSISRLEEVKIRTSSFVLKRSGMPSEYYDKISVLGEGAYGTVIKVLQKATGQIKAMKIIHKRTLSEGISNEEIEKEINILKKLDHPNIMKVYEFFVDDTNFYIITEFCSEGSLYDKLEQMGHFSECIVKMIMFEVITAVRYLHSQKVIHGDLKLENIMIDKLVNNRKQRNSFRTAVNIDMKSCKDDEIKILSHFKNSSNFGIKLIDFGCSKIFSNIKLQELVGTLNYCAPEVLSNNYDEKSDLWSCGVIMYTLLCGNFPFDGKDDEEVIKNIHKGEFDFNPKQFEEVTSTAKDFIRKLLTKDPKLRPSAVEALAHPFLKEKLDTTGLNQNDNVSKSILINLKQYSVKSKFLDAVVSFITHNFAKKEEIVNLRNTFQQMDTNKDGIISKEELVEGYKEMGISLTPEELDKLMKTIDSDNNGKIEYEEFLRATIDKKNLFSDVNLRLAFDALDQDKNGSISLEEILSLLDDVEDIPENVTTQLLAEIDKKKDEEITYESFYNLMKGLAA